MDAFSLLDFRAWSSSREFFGLVDGFPMPVQAIAMSAARAAHNVARVQRSPFASVQSLARVLRARIKALCRANLELRAFLPAGIAGETL